MWWLIILTVLALLAAMFLINFYRNPERMIPKGNNIVSPADGKIISILDTSRTIINVSKGFAGKIRTTTKDVAKECYVLSIFMSPFDVHYNRSPVGGIVKYARHTKGKFYKAYDLEKSFENEKNEILIESGPMRVKVIQIAGFLARRIKCFVKANEKVNKGSRIGMITLGSQATLIIPKSARLAVKMGEKVKAGESVIAQLR